MKQNILNTFLTLMAILLPACSPVATSTPEALPSAQSTRELQYHPLDTLTNIPEIDVIIKAVAGGNPQELIDLFEYTKTTCKNVGALGGPPPCQADEAEGTPVEVLPSLGPEGSFLRKDEAENFTGLNAIGLYAVYRVPAPTHSDANYPAGDYGIVYITDQNIPEVTLQVTNGKIVRIDYIFGFPESSDILPPGVTDFVLEPVSR